MLLGNGVITNKLPLFYSGGVQVNTNWQRDELIVGFGAFDLKASTPNGYGLTGYEKAIKAGNISAVNNITMTSTASGAMGVNAEATADITTFLMDADLQLIVSGYGSTSLSTTASGDVVASLSGEASTTFTITMNHLAMYVDAYGFASANLDLITSGSGTLRAIAICSGSSVDNTLLSPKTIWEYDNRTLTSGGGSLTTSQATQLSNVAKVLLNDKEIKNNQLIIYADDGITPLVIWDLKDKNGNATETSVFKSERV